MKCKEIYELLPDLAAGVSPATAELAQHLRECGGCSLKLRELRETMALLDEWQAPEPSPYFDTRLHARLREEQANKAAGWMQWLRRPALAVSLALVMVVGVTLYRDGGGHLASVTPATVEPGTAVGDLQALDKNHDLYSDFDVLDDLQVQQDVTATP